MRAGLWISRRLFVFLNPYRTSSRVRISTSVAKHEISPLGISHVARKTPYLQNGQAIPQLFNYIKYTKRLMG
jgi:hypothetical protein